MSAIASQITSLTIVYPTVYSGKSKNTSKLRGTGLCEGNSPVTGEFPTQRSSNAKNVSIWWRHHESLAYLRHVCTWDRGTAKYFRDRRNIPRTLKRIPAGLPKRPVLPVVSQNRCQWRRFLSPRMKSAGQFQFRVRSGTRQDWKWK